MKKLFLILALAFAGIFTANAQTWIGGGVGAKIYQDYTHFSISPEFGYNINNHWTIALGASYGFTQDKNLLGEKVTTNELSLEPYVRYIGGTIGHKFSLFLDLTGDFGLIDKSGYAVSLRPGIAWAATEKFTAAFRFGFAGYDHGFYGPNNGFFLNCETVAPEIRFYYSF
ncbi:MAG: hypothetical protein IJQ11_15385 [Bacteroidales bacterium]|jgi:hypothetical protein|nr:hypothetical protein [Bacteroidales bacterium]